MYNFMPMSSKQEIEDIEKSHFMARLNQNMQDFWRKRHTEILEASSEEFGDRPLPLARIRKIMKSDEQVKMISADAVTIFSKASETLIMELTSRAWMHAQHNNRETLQSSDFANAIKEDDTLQFLNNIMPIMEPQQEVALEGRPGTSNDHRVALPENYQSFFSRLLDQEKQENSSSRSSQPLMPFDEEEDPYLIFKKFFPSEGM